APVPSGNAGKGACRHLSLKVEETRRLHPFLAGRTHEREIHPNLRIRLLWPGRLSTYTPQRPTGVQTVGEDTGIGGVRHRFPLTRWSVIEGVRSAEPQQRQRALDVLVSAYWKPVYKYIRLHWGKENEQAKDLTQDFFTRLIEKRLLNRFDPATARLRTYMRVCVDGLVRNTDKASQRQKRGGDVVLLSLDFESAEGELMHLPPAAPGGPEEFFAREFARSLFGLAVDRLREECEAKGKAFPF